MKKTLRRCKNYKKNKLLIKKIQKINKKKIN